MKSLTEFPQTLIKSLSSPAFYQEIIKGKFGQALKYFTIFTLLLGIAKASIVSLTVIPPTQQFLSKLSQNILDLYPTDLVVTITNGEVSTQVGEPYAIPISVLDKLFPQAKSDLSPSGSPQFDNLVVVATGAATTDLQMYKTLILVTKTGIVVPDTDTGGFRYYPIPKDSNLTIDRRLVRSLWSSYSPLLKWVVPVLVTFIWVWFILWYPSWYLTYLIFGTILLKLSLKIAGSSMPFGVLYKIGLYSITLPALVVFFIELFALPIPFLFTLIFVGFSHLMLRTKQDKPLVQIT